MKLWMLLFFWLSGLTLDIFSFEKISVHRPSTENPNLFLSFHFRVYDIDIWAAYCLKCFLEFEYETKRVLKRSECRANHSFQLSFFFTLKTLIYEGTNSMKPLVTICNVSKSNEMC
jgi:hypothetical protein